MLLWASSSFSLFGFVIVSHFHTLSTITNIHFDVKKEMFFAFYNNFLFCVIQANHQHWLPLLIFRMIVAKMFVPIFSSAICCVLCMSLKHIAKQSIISLCITLCIYIMFFFCLLLLSILLWHIVSTRFCV